MPERFAFSNLRELFAKANEEKSGDQLAGVAARSEQERVAAKEKLADLTLAEILQQPLIDPDHDDVSHVISETFDQVAFRSIQSLTVGEFREYILDDTAGEAELKQIQWAIVPEIAAAAAKIMSNKDLILAAAKIRNVSRCRNTMGQRGVLGIRTQPNHPGDDVGGILLAAFEGLLRWEHPDRGLVMPDDFIPLAEETGLILPIGQWALQEGCRRGWEAADKNPRAESGEPAKRQKTLQDRQRRHERPQQPPVFLENVPHHHDRAPSRAAGASVVKIDRRLMGFASI